MVNKPTQVVLHPPKLGVPPTCPECGEPGTFGHECVQYKVLVTLVSTRGQHLGERILHKGKDLEQVRKKFEDAS